MNKKTYIQPTVKSVALNTFSMLCASDSDNANLQFTDSTAGLEQENQHGSYGFWAE